VTQYTVQQQRTKNSLELDRKTLNKEKKVLRHFSEI
jgi:hypothetical protein